MLGLELLLLGFSRFASLLDLNELGPCLLGVALGRFSACHDGLVGDCFLRLWQRLGLCRHSFRLGHLLGWRLGLDGGLGHPLLLELCKGLLDDLLLDFIEFGLGNLARFAFDLLLRGHLGF